MLEIFLPFHCARTGTASKRPALNRVTSPVSCPIHNVPSAASNRLVIRLFFSAGVLMSLNTTKRTPSKRTKPV